MTAAELLTEDETFSEVAVFGNILHLVAKDPEAARAKAKEVLDQNGISVLNIGIITPSLEDVFVTLTAQSQEND